MLIVFKKKSLLQFFTLSELMRGVRVIFDEGGIVEEV